MIQPAQLDHDYTHFSQHFATFRSHFTECKRQDFSYLSTSPSQKVFLEIGAGTGHFFASLAQLFPKDFFIAIERDRMRGKTLQRKSEKLNLPNFKGLRGNAMPTLFHGLPSESVDSIFILYPCPWPKFSQRKNRWYFHAILPDIIRVLKSGGTVVWASDQEFYIDEAEYICREKYQLSVLHFGKLTSNPHNFLDLFTDGRTKFERSFHAAGHPTFELIVRKS